MAEESKTAQTQESDDYALYVASKGEGAEEKSGAGEDNPAAESAEESESSNDQVQEPEGKEEAEPESKEKEPEEPKEKKGGGFQRRIDKLTREKRELEERLAKAEAAAKEKPADEPAKPEAKPKPRSEDFDSFDEFTEALFDWKREQSEAEKASKEADSKKAAEEEAEATQLVEAHSKREEKAREVYTDYDEVMEEAGKISLPNHLGLAILQDEQSAVLAYHLAKNPDELDRLMKLGPVAAVREVGKLSAKLSQPEPKPQSKKTSAPAPVQPLKPAGGRERSIYDKDLGEDIEEYRRLRSKQR